MARILLASIGSLGDLHPYLAMARALRAAGHEVTLASHPMYAEWALRESVGFVAIPPAIEDIGPPEHWAARANHPLHGTRYVVRTLVLPHLERTYAALDAAAAHCELIVSHPIAFAAPLVAERRGLPWLSVALQPATLFSASDPPQVLPSFWFERIAARPALVRMFHRLMRRLTRGWFAPVDALRARLGLPRAAHPLLDGFSPHGTLALFPAAFAAPQPDWPSCTKQLGFPLYEADALAPDDGGRSGVAGAPSAPDRSSPGVITGEAVGRLTAFLDGGAAPVVVTLGSAASLADSKLYAHAHSAIRARSARAVFVAGAQAARLPAAIRHDPAVCVLEYASYARLFARASAIVHQCGIGTTARALASGRPQVGVPHAHDQPDNARRVAALGVGEVVPVTRLSAARLRAALDAVLDSPRCGDAARAFAARLAADRFDAALVDAIDAVLAVAARPTARA